MPSFPSQPTPIGAEGCDLPPGQIGSRFLDAANDIESLSNRTGQPERSSMKLHPTLRVARPSDDLDALLPFYCEGLGLELLYRFENHDGFDGIMIGREGAPYHFEFTRARYHENGKVPSADNLLVFYLPDREIWTCVVERMKGAGFSPVMSFNPYWDRDGATFEDPDGYRIVLQHALWGL